MSMSQENSKNDIIYAIGPQFSSNAIVPSDHPNTSSAEPVMAPMCSKQLLALLRSERKLLKYTIAYDKLCMIR